MWDWKDEYLGERVDLRGVAELFTRRSFQARYVPPKWGTIAHFEALAHIILCLGRDFTLLVDEVTTVTRRYEEGGLCQILRFTRSQRVNVLWASQRPTHLPSTLLSEVNRLHVFHLHSRSDLVALSSILEPADLQRVAALPPHEYLTVTL